MSYLCNLFAIIIFIFITINHTISLMQTNLFFRHVCQKFSLRVLLSFCLIFCKFQPGVAYKSVAYKKKACTNNLFCLLSYEIELICSGMCVINGIPTGIGHGLSVYCNSLFIKQFSKSKNKWNQTKKSYFLHRVESELRTWINLKVNTYIWL